MIPSTSLLSSGCSCGHEGDVEVTWYRGYGIWTCERCGAENTEDGPDDWGDC